MNNDLSAYIDDILDALSETSEKKVTRDDLEKELKKFMEYGVPLDHAKQTLIKKFGGTYEAPSSDRMLVADLEPAKNSVHVLGRVLYISPKEITVKGENKTIFSGLIGDESGSISFTAWNDFQLEKGDVVEIANAYTKEWRGEIQLNLGDRTKIEKTDDSKLPENTLDPAELKVKDLRAGLGSVEVTARILEFNKREVNVQGTKKTVFSGTLGDETGKAQYTSWHDFKFKEGDVLKITGGYVKSWKGIPQLTFDEKATVEKVKSSIIAKKDIEPQQLLMHEIAEKHGAMDVSVEGTVLEIRKGSGFVMRCPECNRALQDDQCSIHGAVEGVEDIRMKLVVDDGTGAVSSILDRKLTEKILGKTSDELKKIRDEEGNERLVEEMNDVLFAKKISLRGNALGDKFGITLLAQDVAWVDRDMTAESETIAKDLEDIL